MTAGATPEAIAVSTMLMQGLQNHVTLHRMSLLAAVMASVGVLGEQCVARGGGPAAAAELAATLRQLTAQVRRQQHAPALAPLGVALAQEPAAHLEAHARALYEALCRLLQARREAQRIDASGGQRVALRLLAGLLTLGRHQYGWTLPEVEHLIATVVGPTLERSLTTPR